MRCLPFLGLVLGLRKPGDVIAGFLKGNEAATTRQRYRIFETPFPAAISPSRAVAIVPSPSPAEYRRPAGRTPGRQTAARDRTAEYGPAIDPR